LCVCAKTCMQMQRGWSQPTSRFGAIDGKRMHSMLCGVVDSVALGLLHPAVNAAADRSPSDQNRLGLLGLLGSERGFSRASFQARNEWWLGSLGLPLPRFHVPAHECSVEHSCTNNTTVYQLSSTTRFDLQEVSSGAAERM
jgi:hypothetical protein